MNDPTDFVPAPDAKDANNYRATRMLTDIADFLAATLAKADLRAWAQLLAYVPEPGLIPRSGHKAEMPEGAAAPKLLRVPPHLHEVNDLLATAGQMGLDNAMLLSQRDDGSIAFLTTSKMTIAEANWLADSAKNIIWGGVTSQRRT